MSKSLFTRRHSQLRKALRSAREGAGLTQTELADRLGRRQAYVSRIERGERRVDVIEFLDLARVLGLDAGRFLADFERRHRE